MIHNPEVVGSLPTPATLKIKELQRNLQLLLLFIRTPCEHA